ncbi:MAG: hypothetical protein JSW11_21780 [Candidatus Heimdallarchaeota archaeon]|nr:MAG: hypothetical protein JSW11_21780 [Candidatus Heimdallarchaeota archaeon]
MECKRTRRFGVYSSGSTAYIYCPECYRFDGKRNKWVFLLVSVFAIVAFIIIAIFMITMFNEFTANMPTMLGAP